jgi:branched-chain amino acid transport system substrate-binding protein
VPITGEGSSHGQDIRATLDLAEFEINRYLQERDAEWELEIVIEDSATSPVIALDKLTAIKAHGIDLVVGTYSSAELRNVIGYATSNNMLLISYASTAPSLGIPGDNIFRFIPDSTKQAPVNARFFDDMGITHVIPFWRGDAWGDGLVNATKDRFEMLGGVFHDGIRYNPEAVEFSTEVALLSDLVDGLAAEVGRDRIGILLLTFSEGVNVAQSAYYYENLADLEWVGSDTLINVGGLGSDRISSEFFDSQISVTLLAPPENQVHDRVAAYVLETVGREPIVYSLTAYEAAWALGLSLYAADSTDPERIAAALPGVLEKRQGVFGRIVLNEAGDLDTSTYEIWRLEDNNGSTLAPTVPSRIVSYGTRVPPAWRAKTVAQMTSIRIP